MKYELLRLAVVRGLNGDLKSDRSFKWSLKLVWKGWLAGLKLDQ